jgi:hypothetical protein
VAESLRLCNESFLDIMSVAGSDVVRCGNGLREEGTTVEASTRTSRLTRACMALLTACTEHSVRGCIWPESAVAPPSVVARPSNTRATYSVLT